MTKSTDEPVLAQPKEGIDFDALPWNLNLPEEVSYVHLTTTTGAWTKEHYDAASDSGTLFDSVHKYSDRTLPLTPSTTSLNYGTTIWEGLKCFRKKDGSAVVFRPDQNYARFARGAEQMCLPEPSRELFLRGVQHAIQQNSHVIPPCGDGMKLYVRPMLLGSGEQLGLYPSPEFSLLFYVSPTVSESSRVRLGSIGAPFCWCLFPTLYLSFVRFSCSKGKLLQECDWRT